MRAKLLILLFFFAVAAAVVDVPEYEDDEKEWDKFKQQFDKHYSPDEEIYRLAIFKATLKGIKEHNEKYKRNEVTWTQGINQFADLTHDEFVNRYTMARWVRQQQEAQQHPGLPSPYAVTAVSATPSAGVKEGPAKIDRQLLRVGLVLPPGYHNPAVLDNDQEMESDDKEWEKFKTKFHKQYATPSEESYRFAVFKLALQAVRTHNKKYHNQEVSWRQGINQFTDLTQQEFESRNNLKPPQGHEHDGEKLGNEEEEWAKFKTRFNRHYSTPKEEAHRKNIFLATLKGIRDHNEKYNRHETSWRQGVNQFADLTQQEFETSSIMTKPKLGTNPSEKLNTYSAVQEQKPKDQHENTGNIEDIEDDDEAWKKFKKEFDRHYSTSDEENYRKGIFMATLKDVRDHNKKYKNKEVSYTLGINQFADLTQQEAKRGSTMVKPKLRTSLTGKLSTYSAVQEQNPEDQHANIGNIEEIEDDDEAWNKFKKEFDRHYLTADEENYRKEIFMGTLKGVREHNKKYKNKEVSYSQGINQFVDLTQNEFATRYTMKDYVRRRAGLILEFQSGSSSIGPAGEIRHNKVAFVKS